MESYRDIIDAWRNDAGRPDRQILAADLGLRKAALLSVWHNRDSIPPQYWRRFAEKAAERGIGGITLESMAALAERKAAA